MMTMRSITYLFLVLTGTLLIYACGGGGSGDPIIGGPTPTIANAGPDRSVALGLPVALNAAGSSAAPGTTLTYAWELRHPDTTTTDLGSSLTASFTPQSAGTYTVTLTVNDDITDTAQITVVNAFMRVFEEAGNQFGRPVAELAGGYLLAGESNQGNVDPDDYDMLLVHTDKTGANVNQSTFDGNGLDETWAMAVDTNNIWLAGFLGEENLEPDALITGDAYLVKSDLNGNQVDDWVFGGVALDQFQAVKRTSDGGVLLCGYTDSAPWVSVQGQSFMYVVKLEENGDVDLNFTTSVGDDVFAGIGITSANPANLIHDCWAIEELDNQQGYLLAGFSGRALEPDPTDPEFFEIVGDGFLVHIGPDGAKNDELAIGTVDTYTEFYALTSAGDGCYAAAGYTEQEDIFGDVYVVKFCPDDAEPIIWERIIPGTDWDEARAIQPTSDGGFIVGGFSYSYSGDDGDALLIKLNDAGVPQWQKIYGGIGSAEGWSTIETSDGGFLVGGDIILADSDNLDMMLIKTTALGQVPPMSQSFTAAYSANEGSTFTLQSSSNFTAVSTTPGQTRTLSYRAIGLPQGLNINPTTGLISGTLPQVTSDRIFPITIIATDSQGLSAAETLLVTVRNVN